MRDHELLLHPISSHTKVYNTDKARNRNIAAEAYKTAVQHLKNELGIPLREIIPPGKSASAKDVYALVETARKKYEDESKEHPGARQCLERLSTRIMYYGKALDTLAQHHPEYVGLAWGAVKFVLTVSCIPHIFFSGAKCVRTDG
jgi:hypothetical protein